MKVMVELELDSREEELLKRIIANNQKMGFERSQERALTDALQAGNRWDTFLYEKMCDYLLLMGGCTYEKSKDMLDEYKKDLNEKYESYKKVDELFKSLPISRIDFTLTTGKCIEAEVDMDYIIKTWNACNTEEGKYLVNTKDYGIDFGLKSHSLLQEGTVTYEDLKRDMNSVVETEMGVNFMKDKLCFYKRESDGTEYIRFANNGKDYLTNGICMWNEDVERRVSTVKSVETIDLVKMGERLKENFPYEEVTKMFEEVYGKQVDSDATKLYDVSFEKNGIGQSNLVRTNKDVDTIKNFFKQVKGCTEVYGVHEASEESMRPGKPIVSIPEDYQCKAVSVEDIVKMFCEAEAVMENEELEIGD